jgi:hypothetical protein
MVPSGIELEITMATDRLAVATSAALEKTAPPVDHVSQALDAAGQWSELLVETQNWMSYVKSLEGMAWKDTLTLIDRLKGPFALAGANDPSLLSKYPALARLLVVAKAAAKKAVATKKRNAKSAGSGTFWRSVRTSMMYGYPAAEYARIISRSAAP